MPKTSNPDEIVAIPTKPCPQCGKCSVVTMTVAQAVELLYVPKSERRNMQEILPDFSADTREQFITGFCDPCWQKLVGTSDDI